MASSRCIINFGTINFGTINFDISNFGISNFGISNFGISNFGISNFGILWVLSHGTGWLFACQIALFSLMPCPYILVLRRKAFG